LVTVVLTQPLPRVVALARKLASAGHEPLVCAFTELQPQPDEIGRLANLRWEDYERVLLVSPSVVQFLLEALGGHLPEDARIGVVGPGSLQALRGEGQSGREVDIVHPDAPPYDAESLLAHPGLADIAGRRLLVLRGERGRVDWIATLASRGAQVEERVLYASHPVEPDEPVRGALAGRAGRGESAVFVVTTRDAARRLSRWADTHGFGTWARAQRVITVHPRIAAALTEHGWGRIACIEPGERSLRVALESC